MIEFLIEWFERLFKFEHPQTPPGEAAGQDEEKRPRVIIHHATASRKRGGKSKSEKNREETSA